MVAGIPPGKVANLYIEAGILLALTLTSTAEVAADLRRAADTIDTGNGYRFDA
jgi:hypothetical protein